MAGAVVFAVIAVVTLGSLPWLASRVRRRGIGAGVLGPFEELWHPSATRARAVIEVQEERRAPTPSPGDPPLGQPDELGRA